MEHEDKDMRVRYDALIERKEPDHTCFQTLIHQLDLLDVFCHQDNLLKIQKSLHSKEPLYVRI